MRDFPRTRDYPTMSAYCVACDIWNKDRVDLDMRSLLKVNASLISVAVILAAIAFLAS